MRLISHRGNIAGKQPGLENMPEYIKDTLEKGYEVEIDVWWKNGFLLGHDEPMYHTDLEFLKNKKLWCHAKNIEALYEMQKNGIHCFWHQEDDVTLTSQGYLWTYPGKKLTPLSIWVKPPNDIEITKDIIGICSDDLRNYSQK